MPEKHKQKNSQSENMALFDAIIWLALFFVIWASTYFLVSELRSRRIARLPPGPYPIPIIGNILNVGQKPHESFAKLSKIYGPLMYLKLGSKRTVVVSSPTIASEVLQKYDQLFSGRGVANAVQALDHHKASIVFLPASSQWRNLRKICKEQLFSSPKLVASQGPSREKLQELCDYS